MMGMNGSCPFVFNFDPSTFKVGDTISYRVDSMGDFPFVATIVGLHGNYLEIVDQSAPERVMKATKESRPMVAATEALG
ncbi:hypothetical protein [Pseudomonas sp. NFX224]|uniref:hypothetical protein n=1 Tax=Pseudomonas sp. NFX224 TaxID=3402862 RepID=UPI003AFA447B